MNQFRQQSKTFPAKDILGPADRLVLIGASAVSGPSRSIVERRMAEIAVQRAVEGEPAGVGRALPPVAEKAAKADLGMDGGFSGGGRAR